jgi:hypothetical protein
MPCLLQNARTILLGFLPCLSIGFTIALRVKKEVAASSKGVRRKWDEQSFFEDAERVVDSQGLMAVRMLYDFCRTKEADIGWGRGNSRGSYSPRFKGIAQRSLFTVFSDGTLNLNFGWLNENKVEEANRDKLAEYLRHIPDLAIPNDYRETYPSQDAKKWCPNVKAIIRMLEKLLIKETNTTAYEPAN